MIRLQCCVVVGQVDPIAIVEDGHNFSERTVNGACPPQLAVALQDRGVTSRTKGFAGAIRAAVIDHPKVTGLVAGLCIQTCQELLSECQSVVHWEQHVDGHCFATRRCN